MSLTATTFQSFRLEQYGQIDNRTPWIPNNALVQGFLDEVIAYPSPYPENVIPGRMVSKEIEIKAGGNILHNSSIVHALETIRMVSENAIEIIRGSVIVADTISLKAPVVKILDDPTRPIRTTVVAKQFFEIEASTVEIQGAAITAPASNYSLRIGGITIRNAPPTTKWLVDIIRAHSAPEQEHTNAES